MEGSRASESRPLPDVKPKYGERTRKRELSFASHAYESIEPHVDCVHENSGYKEDDSLAH